MNRYEQRKTELKELGLMTDDETKPMNETIEDLKKHLAWQVSDLAILSGHMFDVIAELKSCYEKFTAAEKHIRINDQLRFHSELINIMYAKVQGLEDHINWLRKKYQSTEGDCTNTEEVAR